MKKNKTDLVSSTSIIPPWPALIHPDPQVATIVAAAVQLVHGVLGAVRVSEDWTKGIVGAIWNMGKKNCPCQTYQSNNPPLLEG